MPLTMVGMGDLTVDSLLLGIDRLPGWGQEVEFPRLERRLGGCVGNLARGAAALGVNLTCCGPVGQDAEGEFVAAQLAALGCGTAGVWPVPGLPTSQTFAVVRRDGERMFLTLPGALEKLEEMLVTQPLPPGEVVLLSGWCQPPRVAVSLLTDQIARWRAEGRMVAFDVSWSDQSWERAPDVARTLACVDLVFLNSDELLALTRNDTEEAGMSRLLEMLAAAAPGQTPGVILKQGSRGARLAWAGEHWAVPAHPVRALETVGAGDLFDVAFLYARFGRDEPPETALEFAVTYAGLALELAGGALPSASEALDRMQARRGGS